MTQNNANLARSPLAHHLDKLSLANARRRIDSGDEFLKRYASEVGH